MTEKLAIHHLNKTFNIGSNNENHVIRDLSLTTEDGDFVSVIGSNGAGKSRLMNLIAGSLIPDSGDITLNGEQIQHLPVHQCAKKISRVFQDPKAGTARNLMIEENLAIALRRGHHDGFKRGVTAKQRKQFKEVLRRLDMGLENRLETPTDMLSGGQRQALTLLMATIQTPEILLLDKHTAALDPRISHHIMMITEHLVTANHVTTLMITHDMNDAIQYGNRLIMLHQGHIAVDIKGKDKQRLTVDKLMHLFNKASAIPYQTTNCFYNSDSFLLYKYIQKTIDDGVSIVFI